MQNIVIITGKTFTGKSGLADELKTKFGYEVFRTSDYLKNKAKLSNVDPNIQQLKNLGDELDQKTNYKWVLEEISTLVSNNPNINLVVDNVRNQKQLEHFRNQYDWKIIHVHLYCPSETHQKRFNASETKLSSGIELSEWNHLENDDDVLYFKHDADIRINTDRTDKTDTLVRVAAGLNLYPSPNIKSVDVIIGGQYGSEGKGNISAYLANEYDILIRVGGPNAGHTVRSSSGIYTYHQLPSGCRDTNAEILLGPGMTIEPEALLREINDCNVSAERLFIDPQAMIIEQEDISNENELVGTIGSTGQGGGAAAARRILNRNRGHIRLAKDVPELKAYVGESEPYRGSTYARLEMAYKAQKSILLEGTQGSGLSLFHGKYPYVTSRDTNVAGCLAEAGISPSRVRKIIMVVRYTPIRVANSDKGNSSGPLKHEVDFETIALNAALDASEVGANEKTSTTKRERRVGWFDWELFRKSSSLNAPTDIVLTFSDYINKQNEKARRFEQLTDDTIKFVDELERVAQAPVSLISTRFPRNEDNQDIRNVIDRRNWGTKKNN